MRQLIHVALPLGMNFYSGNLLAAPVLAVASRISEDALQSWEVRTGGDTVRCRQDADSDLFGLYTLDYLTNFSNDWIQPASWPESKLYIRGELQKKLPDLAVKFDDYLAYLDNQAPYLPRVWLSQALLKDLHDEGLVDLSSGVATDESDHAALLLTTLPPVNCAHPEAPGEYDILQTVIRNKHLVNGQILYEYHQSLWDELRLKPLQNSLLLVHEWL